MANTFAPMGFRPARTATGAQQMEEFLLDKDLASSLYYGDLVKSDGAGGITAAARGDQYLGIFKGWRQPTTRIGGANFAGTGSLNIIHRVWTPGTITAGSADVVAMVHTDPFMTLEAVCIGDVQATDIGQFVNMEPGTGDLVNGISRQCVGPAINGGPITAIATGTAGSSYETAPTVTIVRNASDPYTTAEEASVTAAVGGGEITGYTVVSGGFYSGSHLPTVSLDHASGGGSGGVAGTVTVTAVTRDQFQIVRVIEKAIRQVDANNNSTGTGLSGYGTYAIVEVRCVNHERGPAVLAAAV